ncbi:4-hydroxy-tetrahydrodipicolinate reductase [Methanocella arvoryzae]|uniref:4-hydroxy-tetrahydrodipicolinate reductase n=1 Tax=Methanocella arvoryzae (strain DSM 22066 / NBRC 105507 / MRE50) TaxID=351160 RepID=Q0W676_METAR|nr:4-hydroxy-tetrahydrodipicolinate reductase [Methanocella arvoryzae]CAH04857.1 dihydrodipicolinate reductase [uncultured archaeon]CAJ36117.1 dihydrodipicolinate reductase [Methanocella arvoryzae MRE50]
MVIKVAITGINGRMGTMISDAALAQPDMEIVAGFDLVAGKKIGNITVSSVSDIDRVLKATKPDVLIDFTVAAACVNNVKAAAANGVSVVVGTTGFDEAQNAEMKNAIEAGKIRAIISPNYSFGVQVFLKLLREAAKNLGDCDIEIIEAHHNKKKDAPSGTALKAADVISSALAEKPEYVYGREGTAPRTAGEIGIHAVRGGDIVGDHTALFACDGERIEIKHQLHSRQALASGAVKAARWIVSREPGIYSMDDVFKD